MSASMIAAGVRRASCAAVIVILFFPFLPGGPAARLVAADRIILQDWLYEPVSGNDQVIVRLSRRIK